MAEQNTDQKAAAPAVSAPEKYECVFLNAWDGSGECYQCGKTEDQHGETFVVDQYIPGAILESSWGYDQTNIDYYKIVKRVGDWLSLVPLRSVITESGDMRGRCRPGATVTPGEYVSCIGDWNGKPIRRRLCRNRENGKVVGLSIKHGWCGIWNGQDSHYTSYA